MYNGTTLKIRDELQAIPQPIHTKTTGQLLHSHQHCVKMERDTCFTNIIILVWSNTVDSICSGLHMILLSCSCWMVFCFAVAVVVGSDIMICLFISSMISAVNNCRSD